MTIDNDDSNNNGEENLSASPSSSRSSSVCGTSPNIREEASAPSSSMVHAPSPTVRAPSSTEANGNDSSEANGNNSPLAYGTPPAPNPTSSTSNANEGEDNQANGMELIGDHGPPVPIGTIEAQLDEAESGGESIGGPLHVSAALAASLEATNKPPARRHVEIINDNAPPINPFDSTAGGFEDLGVEEIRDDTAPSLPGAVGAAAVKESFFNEAIAEEIQDMDSKKNQKKEEGDELSNLVVEIRDSVDDGPSRLSAIGNDTSEDLKKQKLQQQQEQVVGAFSNVTNENPSLISSGSDHIDDNGGSVPASALAAASGGMSNVRSQAYSNSNNTMYDGTAETVNTGAEATDDAIAEMELPTATPVRADEPTATPAPGESSDGPVAVAQQVMPEEHTQQQGRTDEPKRWYQNVSIVSIFTVLVAVIIAIVVGTLLANKNDDDTDTRQVTGGVKSVPTPAPTYPSAPVNCTVKSLGPIWENDECCYCSLALGLDGGTVVMIMSDDFRDVPVMDMQVMVGPFSLDSHIPDDHHIEDIAFSSGYFFSSDALDNVGKVFVSPKNPSGGLMPDETVIIEPEDGDVVDGARFGSSMAVDETVLVVGAPKDNELAGSAFVYHQTSPIKWVKVAKLETGQAGVQNYGNSVLVKGNRVLVAANMYGDNGEGAIFVYDFNPVSNTMTHLEAYTLTNTDCDGQFGSSLAFANDHGLLVSCPLANDAAGAVYYYQQEENNGYELMQKIAASDGQSLEKLGGNSHHISVSPKGDLFAVGTYEVDESYDHIIYVFEKFGNQWLQVAKLTSPDEYSCYFGEQVVITEDRVLVSSWENTFEYELDCVEIE